MQNNNYDLVIRGAHLVLGSGVVRADLGVIGGKIAKIGEVDAGRAGRVYDCAGLHVLPGVIDSHVHFRESGSLCEDKSKLAETIGNGSRAALIGGITAFCDMPNSEPPNTNAKSLADKVAQAERESVIDYGFWVGVTRENTHKLEEITKNKGAIGAKLFMGSTTGGLLVDDNESIAGVMRGYGGLLALHAEDEARLRKRESKRARGELGSHQVWRDTRAASMAVGRLGRLLLGSGVKRSLRLHILHITSAAEVEALRLVWGMQSKFRERVTAEACLHHLTWSTPGVFRRHGALGQVNPPIRSVSQRRAIWAALNGAAFGRGVFHTIGSDHAPHFKVMKVRDYPGSASGSGGVGAMLPVMLTHYSRGLISLREIARLMSYNPARLLGLRGRGEIALGMEATLTLVDTKVRYKLGENKLRDDCAGSLYDGYGTCGAVVMVMLRGIMAMRDGEVVDSSRAVVMSSE